MIVLDEKAHWTNHLLPSDKINVLHVRSIGRLTSLDFDILFRVLDKDKKGEIARRKEKLAQKEKEEIQAEEAIVRYLLMEQ